VLDDKYLRASRIIFGTEAVINNRDYYLLQPSFISSTFRKIALKTHPDRFLMLDEETRKKKTSLFVEAKWAREQLLDFCRDRDSGSLLLSKIKRPKYKQATKQYQKPFQRERFYSGIMPKRHLLFGEFLYYSGAVSWNAFIKSIMWQRMQRPQFGKIAKRWYYLSEEEIREIVSRRKFCEPMGETAVRINLLSKFQVGSILFHQRFLQRPIGEYFVKQGHLKKYRINYLHEKLKKHNSSF
jgi:hypothetical protein